MQGARFDMDNEQFDFRTVQLAVRCVQFDFKILIYIAHALPAFRDVQRPTGSIMHSFISVLRLPLPCLLFLSVETSEICHTNVNDDVIVTIEFVMVPHTIGRLCRWYFA